jgi:hypothetical protein
MKKHAARTQSTMMTNIAWYFLQTVTSTFRMKFIKVFAVRKWYLELTAYHAEIISSREDGCIANFSMPPSYSFTSNKALKYCACWKYHSVVWVSCSAAGPIN